MQQTPKTAAEYQAEMMQLYRRAHPETEVPPTPAAEPPAPEIHAVPEISMPPVAPEVPPEPAPEPIPEPQSVPELPEPQSEPLPESMAEQQLPEEPQPLPESEEPLITGTGEVLDFPQLETEEVPPPQTLPLESIPPLTSKTSYGFLKVITRTASEAMPMPNVTVTVSAIVDGESRLFYTTTTNESGETERIPFLLQCRSRSSSQMKFPCSRVTMSAFTIRAIFGWRAAVFRFLSESRRCKSLQ